LVYSSQTGPGRPQPPACLLAQSLVAEASVGTVVAVASEQVPHRMLI